MYLSELHIPICCIDGQHTLLATGRHPITAAAAHRHDWSVMCEWCQLLCILGGLGTLGKALHPAGDGAPEASYSLVSGHHKPDGPPKGIEMKRFTT